MSNTTQTSKDLQKVMRELMAIERYWEFQESINYENANWNKPTLNRLIITGLDDNVKDGDIPMILVTGNPQSLDTPYDDLEDIDVADVAFQNLDNDFVISGDYSC